MQMIKVIPAETLLKILRNDLVTSLIMDSDDVKMEGIDITLKNNGDEHFFGQMHDGNWGTCIKYKNAAQTQNKILSHGQMVYSYTGMYRRDFCMKLFTDLLEKNEIGYVKTDTTLCIGKNKMKYMEQNGLWEIIYNKYPNITNHVSLFETLTNSKTLYNIQKD